MEPQKQPDNTEAAVDLTAEQAARVQPVSQQIIDDMATMLMPADGVSFDLAPLELATVVHMRDADLKLTTEVPLAFQGVLAALSGLSKVLQGSTFTEPHTQAEYAEIAQAMLAILAKAGVNTADQTSAAESLKSGEAELNALFAEKKLSAMEANYVFNSILSTFETMRLGAEKSLEESMERAQVKMLGITDITEASVGKLDSYLKS